MKLDLNQSFPFLGLSKDDSDEGNPNNDEKITEHSLDTGENEHPLITDLDYRDKNKKRLQKAALWFEREAFQNLIDEKDEDADLDKLIEEYKKKGGMIMGENRIKDDLPKSMKKTNNLNEKTNYISQSDDGENEDSTDSDTDSDSDYDVNKHHVPVNNSKKDGFEIVSSGKKFEFKIFSLSFH